MPIRWFGLVMLVTLSLMGCEPQSDVADFILAQEAARRVPSDLDIRTYKTVDSMVTAAPILLAARGPAVVGSIADIRDVNSSTAFGNLIAELVRSRLTQHGIPVIDLRLRTEIKLDQRQGELMLSRDRRAVYPPPAAAEIVTGIYAVANNTVFVSLKIISAERAEIIAAGDFTVPRTPDVERLLTAGP